MIGITKGHVYNSDKVMWHAVIIQVWHMHGSGATYLPCQILLKFVDICQCPIKNFKGLLHLEHGVY